MLLATGIQQPDPDRGIVFFSYTRYRGGMAEEKDNIKRYLANNNSWYMLMQKSIELDGEEYPQGYHWLIAFHQLSIVTNLTKTLENLPEKHPLKSQPLPSESIKVKLKPITEKLKTLLGTVKKDRQINFSGLHFKNEIDFSNLVFPLNTNFRNTKFSKDAFFNNAIFSKDVFFNNAIFCETADFEDAIFQNNDSYRKETAKFRSTVFEKIANFRNATFWGYANFKGSKLKGRAFFQKATFKWHAPRFYDATFNNEMTWSGIKLPKFAEAKVDRYTKVGEEFEPVKCNKCTNCARCARCVERDRCVKCSKCSKCKALIKQNRRRRIEENQNSYENTSILLEKHRKYHDEHLFFRHEMYCRRWLGSPFSKTIHFLYEWMADYGYGVGLALLWWFVHIILGAVALMLFTICYWAYSLTEFWKILNCVTPVSFANANPYAFFSFDGGKLAGCYTKLGYLLPVTFGIIRIVQTVIGVALLFLLLLTLRVRFRLK